MLARQPVFKESFVVGQHVVTDRNSIFFRRHLIPKRTDYCPFCKALMWFDEKLIKSHKNQPLFGLCCLSGTITIPELNEYPQELYKFITSNTKESNNFLAAVRLYNSILAFTSVSAKVDDSLLQATSGVYTYRIHGNITHSISNYHPSEPSQAKFSQIYIYDQEMQTKLRTGMFPKTILTSILNMFQAYLHKYNPYVHVYTQAGRMLKQNNSMELNIVLKNNTSKDKTKNKPTTNEIAALIVNNLDSQYKSRDIIIKKNTNQSSQANEHPFQFIKETTSVYDPLAYPLFHLHGEPGNYLLFVRFLTIHINKQINLGWQYKTFPKKSKDLARKDLLLLPSNNDLSSVNFQQLENATQTIDYYDLLEVENQNNLLESLDLEGSQSNHKNNKSITARELYAFRFQDRSKSFIQLFGRLYHQYIVDQYAKIENGRLSFLRFNQNKLRVEQYQGLFDAMSKDSTIETSHIGKAFILPSSFIGGPRAMEQLYQDAMAGCRVHGKPNLFVTFTTNPNWTEIKNELNNGQTPNDRPDLIARVFRLKLKALLDDILNKHILGVPVAHVYVIEFQKRGLPHAHILIVLREQDKISTINAVDAMVSAEIPNKDEHPLAYASVSNSLMHGPCGSQFPDAPCMKDGKCSKGFPKPYQETTYLANEKYFD